MKNIAVIGELMHLFFKVRTMETSEIMMANTDDATIHVSIIESAFLVFII
ncbi:hypothetical protein [Virgibacillus siamensis]|nr:hypothetical protein [Virgibacillus siamensis]